MFLIPDFCTSIWSIIESNLWNTVVYCKLQCSKKASSASWRSISVNTTGVVIYDRDWHSHTEYNNNNNNNNITCFIIQIIEHHVAAQRQNYSAKRQKCKSWRALMSPYLLLLPFTVVTMLDNIDRCILLYAFSFASFGSKPLHFDVLKINIFKLQSEHDYIKQLTANIFTPLYKNNRTLKYSM